MSFDHSATGAVDKLLTISIVVYRSDQAVFHRTLSALTSALRQFPPDDVEVIVIDNAVDGDTSEAFGSELDEVPTSYIHGHGNIGFGRGHNLALPRIGRFHLILNPDVEMESDALRAALDFMNHNPKCGLLTPLAHWPDGQRQYLCKQYPAVADLLLRGFAPQRLRTMFQERLRRYEMRDETSGETYWNPPIVSGCFMLFRGETLRRLGGFDPDYFLYFEDFDLSLRSRRIADTAYVPTVKIIHAGGNSARKGWRHIRMFAASVIRFYRKHGLRWF